MHLGGIPALVRALSASPATWSLQLNRATHLSHCVFPCREIPGLQELLHDEAYRGRHGRWCLWGMQSTGLATQPLKTRRGGVVVNRLKMLHVQWDKGKKTWGANECCPIGLLKQSNCDLSETSSPLIYGRAQLGTQRKTYVCVADIPLWILMCWSVSEHIVHSEHTMYLFWLCTLWLSNSFYYVLTWEWINCNLPRVSFKILVMYCVKKNSMYILKLNSLRKAKDNKQNQAEKAMRLPVSGICSVPLW